MSTSSTISRNAGESNDSPIMDRLLNLDDAAKRYRTSKSTAYKRIESGIWPHYRISGRVFIDPLELDEILLSRGRRDRIRG